MTISRGAGSVLLEYLARMCNGGTICQSSAAQIAAATGLPAESITGLRRELVAAGLVVLGRPLGSAPQITLATWHCDAWPNLPCHSRGARCGHHRRGRG